MCRLYIYLQAIAKRVETAVCSKYFEDNMIFNKFLPLPPYQNCTRSKMAFKQSSALEGGGGGGGGVAHCIDFICVAP